MKERICSAVFFSGIISGAFTYDSICSRLNTMALSRNSKLFVSAIFVPYGLVVKITVCGRCINGEAIVS